MNRAKVEGEVTLQPTVSRSVGQSVCLGVKPTLGLVTIYYFLSESCCLDYVGRPLWREDGSAVCSAITQRSESRRTRNQTLLSHLRLPQPGGPGSRIHIPEEQGGAVVPPATGFLMNSASTMEHLIHHPHQQGNSIFCWVHAEAVSGESKQNTISTDRYLSIQFFQ
jgi:hypothetical protein